MNYKYLERREDSWYVKPKHSNGQDINANEILVKFNICLITTDEGCAKAYGIEKKVVEEIRKLGQEHQTSKKA